LVFDAPLGGGPGEFEVLDAEEGNAEGPMSLSVHADGRVFVLDQLNARVQVFSEAQLLREIPIPEGGYQDLAVLEAERLVLLDRLVNQVLLVLDFGGREIGRVPLDSVGIDEPARVSAVWSRPDGVWLEYSEKSVHVLGREGQVLDTRESVDGHIASTGRARLDVSINPVGELTVSRANRDGSNVVRRRISYAEPVSHVLLLAGDDSERIHLVTEHIRSTVEGNDSRIELVQLSPLLDEIRRSELEVTPSYREQFRAFDVAKTGTVYRLEVLESSIELRSY
jgi:hypothetical protein